MSEDEEMIPYPPEESEEEEDKGLSETALETAQKIKDAQVGINQGSQVLSKLGSGAGGVLSNPITWIIVAVLIIAFILWTAFFSFGKNENNPCLKEVVFTTANIKHDLNIPDVISDVSTAATGSDLIVIQEISEGNSDDSSNAKKDAIQKWADENGYEYIRFPNTEQLLFSKELGATIEAQGTIVIPTPSIEHGDRYLAWATLNVGGTLLTFGGTHVLPFIEDNGKPNGLWEAAVDDHIQQIKNFAQEHIAAGELVMIGGDFNINYRNDKRVKWPTYPYSVLENNGSGGVLTSIYTQNGINSKRDHTIGQGSSIIDMIYTGTGQFTSDGYQIIYGTKSDHNFVRATYIPNSCSIGQIQGGASLDMSSVAALARSIAWPTRAQSVVHCSTMVNCGKDRAPAAYIKAKQLAEEKGGKDWVKGLYASCDRFVATVLKNTVDPKVPWGNACGIHHYLQNSPKWKPVSWSEAKPGDPITSCSDHHVMIYLGGNQIADASFMSRVGAVQNLFSYYKKKGGYQVWAYVG